MPRFIGYDKIEFAANIGLFMPFGYFAAAWSRKWWHPLAAGLATSLTFELGQEILLPERFSPVLDVVANTLGAGLGATAFVLLHALHSRRANPNEPENRIKVATRTVLVNSTSNLDR